ncbi:MAG: LLM class flavin-dependent oxidoreductase [Thermomicrobiales bacterium]
MARHPWVAAADNGIRFGVQLVVRNDPEALPRLLETGRWVEGLGFDAIFIFDHPVLHAEPFVCLSALAAVTERVRLGSTVLCAGYRHPVYLARLAADLDNLSRGRFILGLGSGWVKAEFRSYDVPFGTVRQRQDALDETLAILEGVWGPEPFSYEGRYRRTEQTMIEPRPRQQPRPPIMIGGGGEKRTLRQVAQHADACNVAEPRPDDAPGGFASPAEAVRHKFEVVRGHCDDLGRPFEEILRTHFTLNLMMAATKAAAEAKRDGVDPSRSTSPGTRRSGTAATKAFTPDEAVAYYQSLVDVGARYFVVQLDADDRETIELLATDVMPRIAH